jgi:hypothetical protein
MSNIHCWWCCHPFPGPSLHVPIRYDERVKRFTTTGHFCSWECSKSWGIDNGGAHWGEILSFIALMRKQANNNKYVSTHPAPKRQSLQIFGGPLSIEQFRASTSNVFVLMPLENYIHPTVTVTKNAPSLNVPPAVPIGEPSKDILVLKRHKPLARAQSSLEASLGIIRKTK